MYEQCKSQYKSVKLSVNRIVKKNMDDTKILSHFRKTAPTICMDTKQSDPS